jgi:hypothetical protein
LLVAALHRCLLQRYIVGRYKLTLLHGTTHGFAGDPGNPQRRGISLSIYLLSAAQKFIVRISEEAVT